MDLSKLSDEGLRKLYDAYSRQGLSTMSDDQLRALYAQTAPAKPEPTAGEMASEGVGPMQAGLIGAGKATDDLVQGAKQLYYKATGNQPELDALAQQQDEAQRHYGPLKQQNPFSAAIGESLPTMAAMVASGGSSSFPIALAKGALSSGAAEAAKYGTDQERLDRGVRGAAEGALGTGVGWGLGRVVTPMGRTAAGAGPEAVDAANKLGVQLTPGQQSGNVWLRRAEQMLAQRPGSGGVFAGLADRNTAAINKAAASAMGETADAVDSGVFAAARERIGNQFKTLTQKVDVKLGDGFVDALANVEKSYADAVGAFPSLANAKVPKVIDDALSLAAKGEMSGKQYQAVRSALSKQAKDAFAASQSDLGQALKGVASALDDAAGQSMTATERAAFQQARSQWAAMRTLEKGNVVFNGNVSPALVKSAVQQKNPVSYKTGELKGPLAAIARYAEGVRPLSDSGTAANQAMLQAASSPLGFFQTILGNPVRYYGAKGMLSPTGTKWLANGKIDDEARRLLMQGGGLLGIGAGSVSQ